MNPDNKACIAELRISVETRCRPDLDDIDSANILSVIESLQSHIAELETENARLKKVTHVSLPTNTMEQWVASEIRRATSHIKEQLAASQLRETQLRDALNVATSICWSNFSEAQDAVLEKALSLPADTSALDAYVEGKVKVKEATLPVADELQAGRLQWMVRETAADEKVTTLTRQRDLAVEALTKCSEQLTRLGYSANHADKALLAIKESEGK